MKFNLFKSNLLKRNQIVIYAIALLLVTAGYLNFTSLNENQTQETASTEVEETSITNSENNVTEETTSEENTKIADIGDAALVSSNDVVKDSKNNNSNNGNTAIANAVSQETSSNVSNSDDYFTKSKLERDTMYSQMLETYEKVLNSSNSLETQRQTATQEISKINETKNGIMVCENLIGTKGFAKNVVFVNDKELFHFSYERYLINQLRKEFGLQGTPIRMIVRERKEKDV